MPDEHPAIDLADPVIWDSASGHWWRQPSGNLQSGYDLGRDCPRARMKVAEPLIPLELTHA